MGIKYYDTAEGWRSRGYHIPKGSTPIGTNRSGDLLYSWGQTVEGESGETEPKSNNEEIADERAPRMGEITPRKEASNHHGNALERKHESVH